MDNFHFSTAECFENCPARFGFRYRQNIEVLPTDDPANPLILGTAIHRGMEKDIETAIQEYKDSYPIITDAHINEIIKLEYWIPKMKELLPESYLCDWCEYKDYCQKGLDYMILPSAERRQVGKTTKRKLWIYGGAFSGKTTFMDSAPSPLNLNTDGNIQFVTMQYLPIKDTMEGRQKILAWDVFKKAIDELEKTAGQNGFKTIIVDLLEDTYESCRLFMYDRLGITHESDDSFRAWDKVRTEFLSTIRRLMNLDYENIVLISHEDTSKDITKKSGDKITAIKPNIADKVANKIAGMVDIVARVVVEDDETRTLNFKSNEVIFGGGRLKNIKTTSIPLDWNELLKVYDEANFFAKPAEEIQEDTKETAEETPSRRGRKSRTQSEPVEESSDEPVQDGTTNTDSETVEVHAKGQGKEGNKKPVLFPKLVFLYDENLHGEGCINEDVFEAGIECSSKTMYPDWLSLTGEGYVASMYKKYGRVVSPMGCRAFLSPWYEEGGMHPADESDKPVFVGRFNIGAVSLHLPMILAKSRQESKDFYEVLDYYLNMIRKIHQRTYDYLGEMKASTNPIQYCEGGFYGGHLKPTDKIKPLLKPMTASFGITALNELQELYNGKSLVEDGQFSL